MSRKHLPAAVLVSIGCSEAFKKAPRAFTVPTTCRSPMLRGEPVDPGDHENVAAAKEIEHRPQLLAAYRGRSAALLGADDMKLGERDIRRSLATLARTSNLRGRTLYRQPYAAVCGYINQSAQHRVDLLPRIRVEIDAAIGEHPAQRGHVALIEGIAVLDQFVGTGTSSCRTRGGKLLPGFRGVPTCRHGRR
jgi:hypothetical protein